MTDRDLSLTRRQAIGVAGAGGVAFLFAGCGSGTPGAVGTELAEAASATCVMTPAKTEGPFFVDEKLNRSDVRSQSDGSDVQPGTPLVLTMYVFDANGDCAPVPGAVVDLWHASASGQYSDVAQDGTSGRDWLRGYQVTDAEGKVTFVTIWPGWYPGRAVHIHFKVRAASSEFTSQMFFADAQNEAVFAGPAYRSRGNPSTTDGQDGILGGDADTLTLRPTGSATGYRADFSVGLAAGGTATPAPSAAPSPDTAVTAPLDSAKVVRTAAGRRQVRIRISPAEPVTLAARLTRNGNRIAGRKVTLVAGTHVVKLDLGSALRPGPARLTLKLADAAGNTQTIRRSLHVPTRRG